MCIACELGLWIAMDVLPDEPPPGFPRAKPRSEDGFACDAPPESAPPPAEDERKP